MLYALLGLVLVLVAWYLVWRYRFLRDVEVGAVVILHRHRGANYAYAARMAGVSEEFARKCQKRYAKNGLFKYAIDRRLISEEIE